MAVRGCHRSSKRDTQAWKALSPESSGNKGGCSRPISVRLWTLRHFMASVRSWTVAMSILPHERSSCFWQRVAYLYRRLQLLVDLAPDDDRTAEVVGNAFLQLHVLRARSRATQHRLAAGGKLGPETSIDKVLVAEAAKK